MSTKSQFLWISGFSFESISWICLHPSQIKGIPLIALFAVMLRVYTLSFKSVMFGRSRGSLDSLIWQTLLPALKVRWPKLYS